MAEAATDQDAGDLLKKAKETLAAKKAHQNALQKNQPEKKKGEYLYYSGKTSGDESINLVAFIVKDKKNPKQPDIQIYEQAEKGAEKREVATLWKNTSKAGKDYYSGFTNEKEKLIAFINADTKGGKYPSIRAYYKPVSE